MRLTEWLETTKTTQDAFGIEIGVTQGRVSQIARSGTRDFLIMRRIYTATGKMVTPDELLPVPEHASVSGDAA